MPYIHHNLRFNPTKKNSLDSWKVLANEPIMITDEMAKGQQPTLRDDSGLSRWTLWNRAL